MNAIASTLHHFGNGFLPFAFSSLNREDASFSVTNKFAHATGARLQTRHLNVYIHGAHILKDINVEIPRNKITCIIGPSGCGKSTLLRTFNRLNDNMNQHLRQCGLRLPHPRHPQPSSAKQDRAPLSPRRGIVGRGQGQTQLSGITLERRTAAASVPGPQLGRRAYLSAR